MPLGGIRPEKQWIRPSPGAGGFGGGTTAPPVRNREKLTGGRTGGITNRTLKTKPYRSLQRYKGKGQIIRERFEQPERETPQRRTPPAPRGMPQPVMPTPMQPQPQPGLTMAPQPVQQVQPMQPQPAPMPTVVGTPMPGMFGQIGQRFGQYLRPQPQMMPYQPMPQQPMYGGGYGMGQMRPMQQYRRY